MLAAVDGGTLLVVLAALGLLAWGAFVITRAPSPPLPPRYSSAAPPSSVRLIRAGEPHHEAWDWWWRVPDLRPDDWRTSAPAYGEPLPDPE